jgi:dTDP-glucose 4,6-dehydratase
VVTGGAGFLGSHFIRQWLAAHPTGALTNVDALTYAGSRERLADVERHPGYRFVRADIGDSRAMAEAMRGAEAVVHFAAETHVDRSIMDAAPFLRTNVEGTYQVLQQARARGVRRFVHVSTDEVYGPVLDGAVDERARLSPRSPYAASKAAGDLLAQAVGSTYGLPIIVVRPTNVYGPGQLPEKFMPLCITNGLKGRPIPIYGDGQQRRAWLFVDDFCEAVRLLLERGAAGEVYNLAGGHEAANIDVARTVLAEIGQGAALLTFVADRPGHDRRYSMTDAKLRGLGWRPKTPFADGLRRTAAWYREHAAWWRPIVRRLREDPYHWLNRSARAGAAAASGARG